METTVYFTDILMSGMVEKYPDLKILFAHGGGFLPYQIKRINRSFDLSPQIASALKDYPVEYLKYFWYDTVLLNRDSYEYLAHLVGEDRVVPGSDYPLGFSSWPPLNISDEGAKSLLADEG